MDAGEGSILVMQVLGEAATDVGFACHARLRQCWLLPFGRCRRRG